MRETRGAKLRLLLAVAVGCGAAGVRAQTPVAPPQAASALPAPAVEDAGQVFRMEDLDVLPLEAAGWENAAATDARAHGTALGGLEPGGSDEGANDDDPDAGGRGAERADSSAAAGLSYAGLAGRETELRIDGLSAEQSFRGGPRGAAAGGPSTRASFSAAAIARVRVTPRSFSAQFGGAGGVVAVTTRGAAEAGHALWGSAFFLTRESALAAANPFSIETHYRDGAVTSAAVKPGGVMNEVGLALGTRLGRGRRKAGPSASPQDDNFEEGAGNSEDGAGKSGEGAGKRKSADVFGSVEAQVREDRLVSTPALANFYALSAGQVALLGNRGVTAAATNAALNYLDGLSGTTARTAVRLMSFARMDVRAGAQDEATLGYIGNRFDAPSGAALGQASDAVVARGTGSVGDSEVAIDAGTARWVHRFSPRWSTDVRAQVAHDLEYETAHAPLAQEPAISAGGLAPQVEIAPNGFAYGTPSGLGHGAYPDELRVETAAAAEARAGRHVLTLGGDWSRVHDRIAALNNVEGTFLYDSGATGGHAGGLVDWITDYTFNVHAYPNGACPSITAAVHDFCFRTYTQSFSGGSSAETQFVTHEVAGFAEDAVRLRKNLLVTFGARYEYLLLPLPQAPNLALDDALAQAGVGAASGVFPEDRNNVGPRVAAGWATRGGFTVHAGYGAFFGRVPGATVRATLTDTALPSTVTRVRITPATVTQCPQVAAAQGFGYPCAYVTAPPAAVAQTSSATVLSARFRLPAVQRGSFAVERAVGRHGGVRAEYALALATQLASSVDVNILPANGLGKFVIQGGRFDGETFVVPVYTQRRWSQYGPVTEVVSNANATYHAGTVEAWGRGAGVEARGSYTFSRAIDYGPLLGATPRQNAQFDPFVTGYDKGLGSLQIPQRFTGTLLWSGRGALQGWRVAAIAVAGSGAPYSYGVFGGTRLAGGHETLNGSGGATWLPTVGRNTLRLPVRGRVDLRVERELRAGPQVRVSVFAEAFNLLNSQSVSSVETRAFEAGTAVAGVTPLVFQDAAALAAEGLATQRPFGTPTSSTTGLSRELQVEFGVRVWFLRR